MTRLSHTLMLASAIVLLAATTAPAGYLGVANYRNCGSDQPAAFCEAKLPSHTVMRTTRRVVMERQQFTCFKTVFETVYDEK